MNSSLLNYAIFINKLRLTTNLHYSSHRLLQQAVTLSQLGTKCEMRTKQFSLFFCQCPGEVHLTNLFWR